MEDNAHSSHSGIDESQDSGFDAGPSNVDCIETGLWLGNLSAAINVELLEHLQINFILTVDSCPLPRSIQMISGMHTKFLQVTDMPNEDLLSHFQDTYDFIKHGQEAGNILIHCYFGVSRSSTVVIAYLMKKYHISYSDAFERAKSKRKFVAPNAGFENQLKLYEKMNFSIDRQNIQFRLFRLRVAAEKVVKAKILPTDCLDVVKPDPALASARPDPLVYRCVRCRRVVASASNILPHRTGHRPTWRGEPPDPSTHCLRTHFIEPLCWMRSVTHSGEGKLNCPKCNSKLGSFSWIMGCQCPCGAKVSPAFYLVPSKVEWSNMVQNVQITV